MHQLLFYVLLAKETKGFKDLLETPFSLKYLNELLTFAPNNNFEQLIDFPFEVFESDIVQVFWLEDVVPDGNGGTVDVWTPLPQTIFLNGGGSFQYTFNHTFFDVLLFLQGDINLNSLDSSFTNNQIFRIAVIPAEFADANLTFEQVMELNNFNL